MMLSELLTFMCSLSLSTMLKIEVLTADSVNLLIKDSS